MFLKERHWAARAWFALSKECPKNSRRASATKASEIAVALQSEPRWPR